MRGPRQKRPTFEEAVRDSNVLAWLLADFDRGLRLVASQLKVEEHLRVTPEVLGRQAQLLRIHDAMLEQRATLLREVEHAKKTQAGRQGGLQVARKKRARASRDLKAIKKNIDPGKFGFQAVKDHFRKNNYKNFTKLSTERQDQLVQNMLRLARRHGKPIKRVRTNKIADK